MRVGIVGQKDNGRAASLVADLVERLSSLGVETAVDEVTAAWFRSDDWDGDGVGDRGVPVSEMGECDLVVSVGGDGTFLFAARGASSTPIMGVNLGEVGFLNAVSPDDAIEAVVAEARAYLETGSVETRDIARIRAESDEITVPSALNEIVVQGPQRGHGRGAGIEVRIDGSPYTSGRADGVLVSTPTGSTAYNLSEGGPLVHPSVGGFVVTEMCGYESMPPLVVDEDSTVTVRLTDTDIGYVVSDGRAKHELDAPAQITIDRAPDPVRIAGPALDFFAGLGKLE